MCLMFPCLCLQSDTFTMDNNNSQTNNGVSDLEVRKVSYSVNVQILLVTIHFMQQIYSNTVFGLQNI